MRIDAHQHFWRPDRADYGWLTSDLQPLYRDFLPADLKPLLEANGITQTLLVQAAPTLAETDFLLGLAQEHDFIAGVVGWVPLDHEDAPAMLERVAARPLLVGIRAMLQDLADDRWIAGSELAAPLARCAELGLAFDALVRPRHLAGLADMASAHGSLRIVVDHAGKPDIGGDLAAWRSNMAELARLPNVWCKLSGLVTEARSPVSLDLLRPAVDTLLDLFGPGRLIWGSDWPVATLAVPYEQWLEWTEALLAPLSADERAAIMGGNARTFYRLGDR